MASRISPKTPSRSGRRTNRIGSSSVVAMLSQKSDFPCSSICLSPDRKHAVTASKDSIQLLQVDHNGINLIQTIPLGAYFQDRSSLYEDARYSQQQRGAIPFLATKTSSVVSPQAAMNVEVTNVAWSRHSPSREKDEAKTLVPPFLATAGSNGQILIWPVEPLLKSSSSGGVTPEIVHQPHIRSVNKLAWHPSRPVFLSASQDGTVKLWERRKDLNPKARPQQQRPRFALWSTEEESESSYSWHSRTFDPKSEGVRDIKWSPFNEEFFGLVTSTGALMVFNQRIPKSHLLKLTAHSGDATSLDWHPTNQYILATGGSDRSVKVWDLESFFLDLEKPDISNIASNSGTLTSRAESINTDNSSETERSLYSNTFGSSANHLIPRTISSSSAIMPHNSKRSRAQKALLHILSVSASVTNIKWRPPANEKFALDDLDRHSSMLAVSTVPIKGASTGFPGLLALWSYHRPFMPLSVVQGHREGTVMDFDWLETPQTSVGDSMTQLTRTTVDTPLSSPTRALADRYYGRNRSTQNTLSESDGTRMQLDYSEISEDAQLDVTTVKIWQHVISVGRDGRCLIQSFVRGERPISKVPRSCFSMANLSPFQKGFGSIQLFSVYQAVPTGPRNDFLLTGLRKDEITAVAPGIFREDSDENQEEEEFPIQEQWVTGKRLPPEVPKLGFTVCDFGLLDESSKPIDSGEKASLTIAPEVMHMSRFAESYAMYATDELATVVDLCFHNEGVARDLNFESLAHMWNMIASVLQSAEMHELPLAGFEPENPIQFLILPMVKSLLEERANAGDVQTSVVLCEVLQILTADGHCRIPGLNIAFVREWYLSYIDLLRDMCLYSSATYLISNCKDPFVSALNQQSTTIHEACPHCGKPVASESVVMSQENTGRSACKSCRRRIGMCFLCHEPVKGVYVWCAGCGHGGHLECALQWFGGEEGKQVRRVCPTGCGHCCNIAKPVSAFPRTRASNWLSRSSHG